MNRALCFTIISTFILATFVSISINSASALVPFASPFIIDLNSTNFNDRIFPSTIAVDDDGNIYIAAVQYPNPQNPSAPFNDPVTKIIKLDSSGNVLFTLKNSTITQTYNNTNFFKTGSNSGDIAIDSSKNIYVHNFNNIDKFNSTGNFTARIANSTTFGSIFDSNSIAINGTDIIFAVAEKFGAGRIFVLDTSGNVLQTIDNNWAKSIAVDDSGNSYIADGQQKRKFDSSGNLVLNYSLSGVVDGTGMEIDSSGNLYAADKTNNRIQVFDPIGNFVGSFGTAGTGIGQFADGSATQLRGPYDITFDNVGNVYIADMGNNRIQVFPPNLPLTPPPQSQNATIKITKNATNADDAFSFTIFNATNPTNSTTVQIDTTITNMTNTIQFQPGNYSVTETVPLGWTLDASDCEKNGVSLGTTLNFNITLGDSVECIFTNTKLIPPTIKITKNVTNVNGTFNFVIANATNPSNSTTVIIDTSITDMTSPLTVIAGNYSVTETIPAGWILDDSDCEKNGILLGTTLNFNITDGDSVECIFTNTKILGQIQGIKFNDTNENGVQDGIEGGVEGIEIQLFKLIPPDVIGTLLQNVSTGANGSYNFTDLDPGSYRVQENPPAGTVQTFPANGQPHFVDIIGTETISNVNFGNNGTLSGEIRGMKFNDTNRNGIKDVGESGISGVQISIFPAYQTTFTDNNGNYNFTNLQAGEYSVYEAFLSNTVFTTPRTQTVVVSAGQVVENVDFGDTKTLPLPPDMTISSSSGETSNDTPTHSRFTNIVIQKNITVCNPVEPPKVTLTWPDGTVKTSSMTNVSGSLWEATFAPTHPPGTASMRVDIDCSPDTPNYPDNPANISGEDAFQLGDIVFLDPSGTVLDACNGQPIEGATVTLLKEFPPTSANFVVPSTSDHLPADNPQTTLVDGTFGWDVTPGLYKVVVNKTGFVTTESSDLAIPPPVTDLEVILQRTAGCPIFTGGGQRNDVDSFLTYSSPTQRSSNLQLGTTETTIVINYGSTIDANTFKATLNNVDISNIFNPSPSSSEIVTIQLEEGRNTLSLLVDGLRTDGKTATDRDRLVFVAK